MKRKTNINKKHPVKIRTVIADILILFLFFLAAFLILVERWAFSTWSSLDMEEILYELINPIQGTAGEIMNGFYFQVLFPALAIAAAAGIVFLLIFPKKIPSGRFHLKGILSIISLCVIAGAVAVGWRTLDIGTWIRSRNTASSYIEDNYVDPAKTEITFPEKKRNLIYIFLESMEVSSSDKKDGGAFKDDYIPELTQLAQENEDFSGNDSKLNGGISTANTGWTIGAMFAQTSGLPLKVSVDTNSYNFSSFFPNMTALGDILEKEGYNQTLLVGSDITFASRDVYFTDHGNYHLEDYNSMLKDGRIPQGYKVWWGYEDKKLFQFAREDLEKIGNSGQPFNYTMLTVDTHFPDGYVCDLCRNDFGDNQYANVIACSSRQVADFVDWVQQQSWYENTTIIISGDHPTMDSKFSSGIPSSYQRKVYTCYINADAEPADPGRTRIYSTLDNFPTTIAALGAKIDGDRLGLGTNLFSSKDTLIERDGLDKVNRNISQKSSFMDKLAAINKDDLREYDELKKADVQYTVEMQDDGTIKVTADGFSDVRNYIESVYFKIYLPDSGVSSLTLSGTDNGDGTYSAIFDPNTDSLAGNDKYSVQAFASTRIGDGELGARETILLKTLKQSH